MVKILRNKEYNLWGLYDPQKRVLIKWTDGWETNWEGKSEFAFSVRMGTKKYGYDFKDYTEQKTIEELKSLDLTNGELQVSYDDSYEGTEYSDRETNDACRVPDFEWCNYYYRFDNEEDGKVLCLSFENHGTPWFVGDCYEMPDDEYHQWDNDKEGFEECTSEELTEFKERFIDALIKQIENSIKKTSKKLANAKKAKEDVYASLADSSLCAIVEKHYGNKKPPKAVIEIANEIFAASQK